MSKKTKKKNNNNKDVIVVLFIFAIMILAAVGMTMCGRDKVEIGEKKANTSYEKKEEDNSGEIVVMTTVGVAVVIVICFVVKKAKETERRNKLLREYNERMEQQQRVEEARERVRQARLQEMIDAGIQQLTERDKKRGRGTRYTTSSNRRWDDGFDTMDIKDKRLDLYYRNKYDDLLDDDLWDDTEEIPEEEIPTGFFEKIKYAIASLSAYWWIVIGVGAVAIIGGAIIAMFVL